MMNEKETTLESQELRGKGAASSISVSNLSMSFRSGDESRFTILRLAETEGIAVKQCSSVVEWGDIYLRRGIIIVVNKQDANPRFDACGGAN